MICNKVFELPFLIFSLLFIGAATTLADFAAARGRDYNSAVNYSGHYQGFLDASRASQQFGWPPLPPALHSMQGNSMLKLS